MIKIGQNFNARNILSDKFEKEKKGKSFNENVTYEKSYVINVWREAKREANLFTSNNRSKWTQACRVKRPNNDRTSCV